MDQQNDPEDLLKAPPRRPRRVLAGVLLFLLFALALLGAAGLLGYQAYNGPGPLAEPKTIIIPKGSGTLAIAEELEAAGIIRSKWLLMGGVMLDPARFGRGTEQRLKAGEYAFLPGVAVPNVLRALRLGQTVVRRLTVPEGLTTAQVLSLVSAADGLDGPLASPPPAEGGLLPETYYYSWGDSRAELVNRMRRAMDDALAGAWSRRAPDLPVKTIREALTLASIVEKETGIEGERPRVAAVFVNRLNKGMKLQSDPTVIYAVTKGEAPLTRALSRADLDLADPYNTYTNTGLPPGPIANPGRAAIDAALHPAQTADLFFVADGTGGHAFARTLDEHNRNVARWRQQQAKPDPAKK